MTNGEYGRLQLPFAIGHLAGAKYNFRPVKRGVGNSGTESAGGVARGPGRPSDAKPRIITAAGELFGRLGYHGTSMRDIAAHGNVPLASITYFFKTKQNLFVECLRESLEDYFDYQQMFAPEPLGRSAAQAAAAIERKIFDVYHRFYNEEQSGKDPWQPAIILSAVMSREPFHVAPMGRLIGASREYFAPRLKRIRPKMTDGEMFAWHMDLWAMISFPTTCRSLILGRLGQPRYTRRIIDPLARYTVHLMLNALKGNVEVPLPPLPVPPSAAGPA